SDVGSLPLVVGGQLSLRSRTVSTRDPPQSATIHAGALALLRVRPASSRKVRAIAFCWSNSARRRPISSGERRAILEKSSFQSGLLLQRRGDCTVVRGWLVAAKRSRAKSSVARCEAGSFGRPAGLPRGKSENNRRGTPTYSTISLAQPSTTVAMPALSKARAARLALWWQTGQFGNSSAASTPSALQRVTSSGQSTSRVTR